MALQGTGLGSPRLLPDEMEEQLRTSVGRFAGFVLAALALLVWVSLLTWSRTDLGGPADNVRIGNVLRLPGAIISDFALHAFGLVVVPALAPALVWALRLIGGLSIPRWRWRLMLWITGALALAGAAAAVPTLPAWPMRQGFGGLVGDLVYAVVAGVVSVGQLPRAGAVSGLLLLLVGAWALCAACGANRRAVRQLVSYRVRREPRTVPAPDMTHRPDFAMRGDLEPRFDPPFPQPEAPLAGWQRPPMHHGPDPGFAPPPHVPHSVPQTEVPAVQHVPPPAGGWAGFEPYEAPVEPGLDHDDADSMAIARRFAPSVAGTRPPAPAAPPQRPIPPAPAAEPPRGRRSPLASGGVFAGLKSRPAPGGYKRPSLNLLKRPPASRAGPELAQNVQRGVAKLLEDVLLDFGVKGKVQAVRPGPVVTLYEVEPARGIKGSRVIALADDVARSMSATSARVALVPGRNVIGIELPNTLRETVYLRELLEHDAYRSAQGALPIVLGKAISGDPVVADLARMPHLLVAGTTGSGKSVGINTMILSLLYRLSPDECRFIMIDPKMLELSVYNGIPHLLSPVITDPQKAVAALNWVVREMEERYKRMSALSVRSIDVYNNRVRNAAKQGESLSRTVQTGFDPASGEPIYESAKVQTGPMPYIVVVVDEMADLMLTAGKEIEGAVQRLAQMARAAGIHLIMATQRPSVDVVTGTIKANFPTRVSFKVASKIDSRTILGEQGAEQLLGAGDMLYAPGSGNVVRVHGPFVADEEVEHVAAHLRSLGEPEYLTEITELPPREDDEPGLDDEGGSGDDLFDKAVALVVRDGKASTSYIQRRLSIGYNRAADLMERMEAEGIVSPANSVGKRDILAGRDGSPVHRG